MGKITRQELHSSVNDKFDEYDAQKVENVQQFDSKANYYPVSTDNDSILYFTYSTDYTPMLYTSQNGKTIKKVCDVGKINGKQSYDYAPCYINGYWYIAYDHDDHAYNDYATYQAVHGVGGNQVWIARTTDFITFEEWQVSIPLVYKSTWAPELFVDGANIYLYISMSKCDETSTDYDGNVAWKKYCYVMQATDATLTQFGSPTLVSLTDGAGTDVSNKIDPFVYKLNSNYYLFIKEDNNDYIQQYKSSSPTSGYSLIKTFSDLRLEGPSVVKFDNKYFMYAEQFWSSGYYVFYVSEDMESWGTYTRTSVENDIRLRHFTPVNIDTTEKKALLSALIKKGGSKPFSQYDAINRLSLSGTYDLFTLVPNALYNVPTSNIATISRFDSSLMKTGDRCYFVLNTYNADAKLTFTHTTLDKVYWDMSGDLVITTAKGYSNRMIEIVCLDDGYCYIEGIIASNKVVTYSDTTHGLTMQLYRNGNVVSGRLYGTTLTALTAHINVTFTETVDVEHRPPLNTNYGRKMIIGGASVGIDIDVNTNGSVQYHADTNVAIGVFIAVSFCYIINS